MFHTCGSILPDALSLSLSWERERGEQERERGSKTGEKGCDREIVCVRARVCEICVGGNP